MTTSSDKNADTGPDTGPEQLQADIERTRAELGDTIDQLAGKLDVKTRAREKAATTKQLAREKAASTRQQARTQYEQLRAERGPVPAGAAAALLAVSAVVALVVWRRRR